MFRQAFSGNEHFHKNFDFLLEFVNNRVTGTDNDNACCSHNISALGECSFLKLKLTRKDMSPIGDSHDMPPPRRWQLTVDEWVEHMSSRV